MGKLAVTLSFAVTVLAATAACTSRPSPTPSPKTHLTTHCAAHGISRRAGMPEIRGVSVSHASLWGLVFASYPLQPQKGTKIVWRMTGSGPLSIRAEGPDGQTLRPSWGPEYHGSSTWHRPGEEWGTEFRFPAAGCWTIEATRGSSRAVAGVLVS